jgi:hypothetical protein
MPVPPLIVPVPIGDPPSSIVTVPVAAPADTVAVNVTEDPKIDGLAEEDTVTVVGSNTV